MMASDRKKEMALESQFVFDGDLWIIEIHKLNSEMLKEAECVIGLIG